MNVVKFTPATSPAKLKCSACGATAEASCNCGAAYVPARDVAAKAIADNPELSARAIAAKVGVDEQTVRAAMVYGTAGNPAVDTMQGRVGPDGVTRRLGRDGKWRRLPTPQRQPDRNESVTEAPPAQSTPITRFLNVAWDAEHRPREFDFSSMTNFGELAAAAERVAQAWSTAAKELRRLESL